MPITVHIDDSFSATEKKAISKSFNDWMYVSNYSISFVLHWNEPNPGPYKDNKMTDNGIFLWKIDKTSEQLSDSELKEWATYRGVWQTERSGSGNIIIFSHITNDEFYQIVTHEIGHMLGLGHMPVKYKTLMHPNTASNCITRLDARQLCSIYKCKPKPLC